MTVQEAKKEFPVGDRWKDVPDDAYIEIRDNDPYLDLVWQRGEDWIYITSKIKPL